MSYFNRAITDERTKEVGMDQIEFISFAGAKRAIGIRNLGGSIAIALVSPCAAILACLAPVPERDTIHQLINLSIAMNRICRLYQENRYSFHDESMTLVVAPAIDDASTFKHHIPEIRARLEALGLARNILMLYETTMATFNNPVNPENGTVLIDARSGEAAGYAEGKLLFAWRGGTLEKFSGLSIGL